MRVIDKRARVSRREVLGAGAAIGAISVSAGAILCPEQGWAMETKGLAPETMRTLIQVARDIYPHDQIADKYYAIAVKGHDDQAADDADHKALIEGGIATLDSLAQSQGADGYANMGWESDRVALLRQIENTPFFQTVRGGLVVGLYNQKALWWRFGYEGASFDKGGYIERGFDDIAWL